MRTAADTSIRARIDSETKRKASLALQSMGLSVSDAIRMLMVRIAEEKCMPFDIRTPNKSTQDAIEELEAGHGKKVAGVNDLMADLNADD